MELIMDSIIMILIGTLLLRVAGRKSISQMTVAQTVIMISIGSIIIQPIIDDSLLRTAVAASVFIAFLISMEYLQMKYNFLEKFLTGNSVPVIENGQVLTKNLKRLRFTVDQLEIRLRQQGISNVRDVQTATLEPNGQLGYELKRSAKPVTVGDMEEMLKLLVQKGDNSMEIGPMFKEVIEKKHEAKIPDKFQ
ncbi:DUF421 domain-containing protein [Bacillus marinisedimentorum]|uniref:DUF421 domain-containing protein n=1 Tax=Bacillus marinisedimentorum TaxID=1821260 RepID=UPI000871B5EE|nr:YetF domain-containing protein [Bacillus marinisedimentorum]